MHNSLEQWKKDLDKALKNTYFHPKCDFCHNELIMSVDEMEIVLFEPKEIEEEVTVIEIDDVTHEYIGSHKEIKKRTVSSDPDKDIFKFKCPVCGHYCKNTRKELNEFRCSYYGDNNIRFELDEVETKNAIEFIKEHDHTKELIKEKRTPFFSTLGQQFTYEITPGGLGDIVSITCNHCKESKDITNIENW